MRSFAPIRQVGGGANNTAIEAVKLGDGGQAYYSGNCIECQVKQFHGSAIA